MHYLNRHMHLFSEKCLQHLFKRFLQGNQSVNYVISTPITIILDIKLYYTYQCNCFRMSYHYYIIYVDGQRSHICNNNMIVQALQSNVAVDKLHLYFHRPKLPLLVKWCGHASLFHVWIKCQPSHINRRTVCL